MKGHVNVLRSKVEESIKDEKSNRTKLDRNSKSRSYKKLQISCVLCTKLQFSFQLSNYLVISCFAIAGSDCEIYTIDVQGY